SAGRKVPCPLGGSAGNMMEPGEGRARSAGTEVCDHVASLLVRAPHPAWRPPSQSSSRKHRLLHAHRATAALVHARDRLDWVRAAFFIGDGRQAMLDRGPVDAAGALIRVEVIGNTAANLIQADSPRRVLLSVTDVVAGLFAIAPRIRESVDDGRIGLDVGHTHRACRRPRRFGRYYGAVLRVLAAQGQYACTHQGSRDCHAKCFHDEPPLQAGGQRPGRAPSRLDPDQGPRDDAKKCEYAQRHDVDSCARAQELPATGKFPPSTQALRVPGMLVWSPEQ